MTAEYKNTKLFWLDRVAQRLHRGPWWLTLSVIGLFSLLPFVVAYASGALPILTEGGLWRIALLAPVNISYTLLVSPVLTSLHPEIADRLQPLASMSKQDYESVVAEATHRRPRAEWIAFLLGVGMQIALFGPPSSLSPLDLFLFLVFSLMYGVMGWIIYKAIASTRLSRSLCRLPLSVNIFDITPFQPIGRQSLHLSMVFVGGIIVSMVFVFRWEGFLKREDIIIYATVLFVAVLVFYLGMWPTHRLLSETRRQAVNSVTLTISNEYEQLAFHRSQGGSTDETLATIDAWIALERRLKVTRTWPYDTEMLRTLVITVLMPIIVAASKIFGLLFTAPRP